MYLTLEAPVYISRTGNQVYQYAYDSELNVIATDYFTLEMTNSRRFKKDDYESACHYADRGIVPDGTEEITDEIGGL